MKRQQQKVKLHLEAAGKAVHAARGLALSPMAGATSPPSSSRRLAADASLAFAPARTLGGTEAARLAMDEQLRGSGSYNLLQHAMEMGYAPSYAMFVGYGALQNIAQDGLVRACVETVADDMTRNWITLKQAGQSDAPRAGAVPEEKRVPELERALRELHVRRRLHEACEMVGYEGGCMVFIDTGVSGDALLTPLNLSSRSAEVYPGSPLEFRVVDPINVFPGRYNSTNPLARDYYQPRTWWVLAQEVHASRLLRLVANEPPTLLKPAYNFFGIPQAQLIYDSVLHFKECNDAEARLLSKFSMTVLKTQLSDVLFQGAASFDQIDKRVNLMVRNRTNDGVQVIDKEAEDIVKVETPLSGVTDIVRQSLEILAAKNRTPAVKLLGISPSGFNATGESDIRNYYDHIASQQEKVLRDVLEKILTVLQLHLFGDVDSSITFGFSALGETDESAQASRQKTKADTAAIYLDRDVVSPAEVRRALADDADSNFTGLDPDDLPEPQNMPDELPENAPPEDAGKAEAGLDAKENAFRETA